MKTFLPKLLKPSKGGHLQQWEVWYRPKLDGTAELGTVYGRACGKLQEHSIIIKEGKNIGRKNETTPLTQAEAEAKSMHAKQIRTGYSLTGEVVAEKGVMLAADYLVLAQRRKGVDLPGRVIVSPKLDGIRSRFISGNHVSRGHLNFRGIPSRITEYLNHVNSPADGEMYIHGIPLRRLNGLVNRYEEGLTERLQYHIFDLPVPGIPVEERKAIIAERFDNQEARDQGVIVVPYETVASERVEVYKNRYVELGFEGVMINLLGFEYLFQNKRDNRLIKWKDFFEREYIVTELEEDADGGAKAVAYTDEGVRFTITLKAEDWIKEDLLRHPEKLVGLPLTTRYQTILDSGIPQFARGIVERIYEGDIG